MKRLKKELSLLLVMVLVISSMTLGVGQINAQAYADANGTGSFMVVISVPQNNCNTAYATEESFQLRFLNASGGIVSTTASGALSGVGTNLNNNTITSFNSDGSGSNQANTVPAMGTMIVNKTITQLQLICSTNNNDDWNFSNFTCYYYDGSAWQLICNQQWLSSGNGATVTWPVTYFTSNDKTLTFDANGGSGGGVYEAIPGQTISAPAITKQGYAFVNWSPSVPARMPSSNTTYTAQWKTLFSTITFDANEGVGGTGPVSMEIGSQLTSPLVTREGYTFIAWSPSVASTVPISDRTYTAIWLKDGELNENIYNVIFDPNGGIGIPPSQSIAFGQTAALASNVFSRTGYTFLGWAVLKATADALDKDYVDGSNLTMGASDITLYAVWSPNQYTIIFSANGGASSTSSLMVFGEALSAPLVTRTGYTFTGWSPSVPDTVPFGDTTYTAQWAVNTYTVVYTGNGSTGGSTASSSHTYGVSKALAANGFTKTGYNFTGWATSAAGVIVYSDKQTVINLTPTNGAVIMLYAKWSNSCTITFNANGGTGGTSTSMTPGAALTAPTVTRTGYKFTGWLPTVPATVPAVNTTYTAQWSANTYTVTLNPQGGLVSPTTLTVTYAAKYGVLPTPTKSGCEFLGWYTATFTGTKIISTTTVTITAAQTLYAKWKDNNFYTITFDANGGSGTMVAQSIQSSYSAVLSLNTFSKVGYTFAGWATTSAGSISYSNGATYTMGIGNIILYAKWSPITYTVFYNGNDATSGSTLSTSHTYDLAMNLRTNGFFKTGYSFSGWNTAADGSGTSFTYGQSVINLTSTNGAIITLYAVWTIRQYSVIFNSNGGSVTEDIKQDYNTLVSQPGAPTKAGYIFGGWYADSYFSELVVWPYTIGTGDITFYALWSETQIMVTFDANGGKDGMSAAMNPGDSLTAPTVTKTGYTFDGWTPTVPANVPFEDTTYTAKWIINSYTIIFDDNGGMGGTNTLMEFGSEIIPPTVTKSGCAFTGWSPSVPATVPAENATYTARWSTLATVNFSVNNVTGFVGEIITISVVISENSNVGAGGFKLPYDSNLLEYIPGSYVKGEVFTDETVTVNTNTPGIIILGFFNADQEPLMAGGNILTVSFRLKEAAANKTIITDFTIDDLSKINGEKLEFSITQGTITTGVMLGDVNGDGIISPTDAMLVMQAYVGNIVLTESQMAVADVNKDGMISPTDSSYILQYYVGSRLSF